MPTRAEQGFAPAGGKTRVNQASQLPLPLLERKIAGMSLGTACLLSILFIFQKCKCKISLNFLCVIKDICNMHCMFQSDLYFVKLHIDLINKRAINLEKIKLN